MRCKKRESTLLHATPEMPVTRQVRLLTLRRSAYVQLVSPLPLSHCCGAACTMVHRMRRSAGVSIFNDGISANSRLLDD
jgi:hypothetical protein